MGNRGKLLSLGLALACFACSSSADHARPGQKPSIDGFRPFAGLGNTCSASVAEQPATAYGPLSFIPCTWGEAYCKELDWHGALKWNPGSTTSLFQFSLQAALDATGAFRRILVTRQYTITGSSNAVPFEAVAYDAKSGKALAAWRDPGDSSSGFVQSCLIDVATGMDDALVLAVPSNSTNVVMARQPLDPSAPLPKFDPIDASRSVMKRDPIASSHTAAFYEDSGRMWRVDLAGKALAEDNGPQRLWPTLIAGDDVLARTASPTSDGYYWFKGVGSYTAIDVLAPALVADAKRFGWVTATTDQIEVKSAPRSAPDPSAAGKVVATIQLPPASIPVPPSIIAATIGDGVMAIQTSDELKQVSMLYMVTLATGAVRQEPVQKGPNSMKLLANSATQAWFGYSSFLSGDETQFDAIVMLDMSPTCTGTLGCSGLSDTACGSAPGCTLQATCTGTPTDPCTYTNETDCFAHVCSWDSLNQTCSTVGNCDHAPQDACTNTAGCTWHGCVPTISGCGELGPQLCRSQPGCSVSGG